MFICLKIIYIFIDEVFVFVIYLFFFIVKVFVVFVGIDVEISDIFFVGCILVNFVDCFEVDQCIEDDFVCLVVLVILFDVNIIKLFNISVLVFQLKGVIVELQGLGYKVFDFLEDLQIDEEKEVCVCYVKIFGSVVNLVLCEGNFDCCVFVVVKVYVCKYLYFMGKWSMVLCFYVDYMCGGDFFFSEQFIIMVEVGDVCIEFVGKDGKVEVKK